MALFSREVISFLNLPRFLLFTFTGQLELASPNTNAALLLFYSRACCGSLLPSAPFPVPTLAPPALMWSSHPQVVWWLYTVLIRAALTTQTKRSR